MGRALGIAKASWEPICPAREMIPQQKGSARDGCENRVLVKTEKW